MKKFGNALWGIVLILIGVIIGGNALGITNIEIFFDGWWTLFIIVPCFIGLFNEKEKTGNIIGLLIGLVLLLSCQNILDFDIVWKLLLPTILVIIGLTLVFKDTFNCKVSQEIKKLNQNKSQKNEFNATFSGQDVKFDGEVFEGTELTAIFGGIDCDLRNSIIESDVVVNATAIFGGIEIKVPKDIKVKVKSSSIFGGVSNEKKYNEEQNGKIIYINATCIFGGVEIK